MVRLDPPIAVRQLTEVTPGSIVQHGEHRGFCGFAPRSPLETRVMLLFDPNRDCFRYRRTPVGVLDFSTNLIIKPNLTSMAPIELGGQVKTKLLLIGDSPKIFFHVEDESSRTLDLKTGAIEPVTSHAIVAAFTEWKVGVSLLDAEFLPLLEIRPRVDTSRDEGPLEPDED